HRVAVAEVNSALRRREDMRHSIAIAQDRDVVPVQDERRCCLHLGGRSRRKRQRESSGEQQGGEDAHGWYSFPEAVGYSFFRSSPGTVRPALRGSKFRAAVKRRKKEPRGSRGRIGVLGKKRRGRVPARP